MITRSQLADPRFKQNWKSGISVMALLVGCSAFPVDAAHAQATPGIEIGDGASAPDEASIAIGKDATSRGVNVAVGPTAEATGTWTVAVGSGAQATRSFSTAIGMQARAVSNSTVAIGTQSGAQEEGATAVGAGAFGLGIASTAVGRGARARRLSSVALGENAHANGAGAIGIGTGTIQGWETRGALADFSVAIGSEAVVGIGAINSIALGKRARVDSATQNALALGSDSLATETGTASFGNASTGLVRRIVNIADGVGDNDAVTVAQLNNAMAAGWVDIDALIVAGDPGARGGPVAADRALAIGPGARANQGLTLAAGLSAEASGDGAVALGSTSAADGGFSLATGTEASAEGTMAVAVGGGAKASGDYAVALGTGRFLNNSTVGARADYSMAFGFGSSVLTGADRSIAFGAGAQVQAGVLNAFALGADSLATQNNTISVGNATSGLYRRITNLADGTAPRDAATVGQVNALIAHVPRQHQWHRFEVVI